MVRGRLRGMLGSLLIAAAVVYVAGAALLYAFQPRFIYFPGPPPRYSPADLGLAFEEVSLAPEPGSRVHGWWVPAGDDAPVLLFLHGNAGSIGDRLDSIALFHELGLSVLIIDYRGYGASSGTPGEAATLADARAAWEWLVGERGIPPRRIALFGRSLGGAVAIALATEVAPAALVVESTFTSVADMAAHYYPWLPARLLVRIRYPSLERMARVRGPVLVAHSPDDEIVPFAMGRALYEAAGEPREFLSMRGGHNEGFLLSGTAYSRRLGAFVHRHAGPAN